MPPAARPGQGRFSRQHALMLVLALEILVVGAYNADRYRRPGISVDVPATRGHVIV
ncbi:hypothetical protein MPPM_3648 [Methylorubrum populi]|jgi:hypothetical protein|uniref:Uncharacterized protein n=1 Tax=Methylorubrum populi TaxID=223967 RepID=A0A160PIJ8_9HYPH|nr:hypothetical protein [Methylorubrum populi]BAU92253.1 hypothetical protein MPPM_3648 [Methylorubrum populi]